MTVDEFNVWLETEPDDYELLDGEPVRIPELRQGGRRRNLAFRAAVLTLSDDEVAGWMMRPLTAFHGRKPYQVASASWRSLLELLAMMPPPADPRRMFYEHSWTDIWERAQRLAEIEAQRQDALLREVIGDQE